MGTNSYLPIVVLLVGAVGFAVAPLALAWLWAKKFSPQKPGLDKNAVYECGLESSGDAWVPFKTGYYHFSAADCLSMLVFLFLLIAGLAWAWQKKVLAWT